MNNAQEIERFAKHIKEDKKMKEELTEKYPEYCGWNIVQSHKSKTCDKCKEEYRIYFHHWKKQIGCRCWQCFIKEILDKYFVRRSECNKAIKLQKRLHKEESDRKLTLPQLRKALNEIDNNFIENKKLKIYKTNII